MGHSLVCHVPFPVHPISFSVPEELMLHQTRVHKSRVVAEVVPGRPNTYIHTTQEGYYKGYSIALFGMTWKKSGWDCMRHYEILAAGALPYMPDIEDKPNGTMFRIPTELLKRVIRMPGIDHAAIAAKRFDQDLELINDGFDIGLYEALLSELMAHARSYLTTVSMANYLLEVAGFSYKSLPKVLFLAMDRQDYQAESLFHGLRTVLGPNAVDFPIRHWMFKLKTREEEDAARNSLHAKGFSYAFTLDDVPAVRGRSDVEADIAKHYFDLVIYGTAYVTPLPLYDMVRKDYSKDEIVFVDGSDTGAPETDSLYSQVCGKQGICFRRELVC